MLGVTENVFTWVCVAGIVGQMIIRAPYAQARAGAAYKKNQYDLGERLLIFLVFAGMVAAPMIDLLWRGSDGFDWRFAPPADVAMGAAGVVVLMAALWLFWRSHADLGRNWSPSLQVRSDHSLVTSGVYTHLRHPMYAALWLVGIAQVLLLQNWLTGPACLVGFLPMHLIRIPREEQMLRAEFGADWDEFARTRGRVTPRW